MLRTTLKIAMLASILAGCQTLCGPQLAFIRTDFEPIGPKGSASNDRFQKDKAHCVAQVKASKPSAPMDGIDDSYSSIDPGLKDNATAAETIKAIQNCMKKRDYELVEGQGRSSG